MVRAVPHFRNAEYASVSGSTHRTLGLDDKRACPWAPAHDRSARRAGVLADAHHTLPRDEVQVSAGAQSEPAPLLHPWKGSSDALAAVSMSRT